MDTKTLQAVREYAYRRMNKDGDFRHDWDHIERVVSNARKAVKILCIEPEIDEKLLYAMCYVHDLPMATVAFTIPRYFQESAYVRRLLPPILNSLPINPDEKTRIFRAVAAHPFSIPWRRLNKNGDLYTQLLQDADSLDYFAPIREHAWISRFSGTWWSLLFPLFRLYNRLGRRYIAYFLNIPELARLYD